MESAKPANSFKYDHYDIDLHLMGEQKLGLTILDSISTLNTKKKN